MNRHMRGPGAPAKGEKMSVKGLTQLYNFCRKYMPAVVIALVCAVGGTIFTIIGPDKLSELTDVITSGIVTGINFDEVTRIALTLAVMYGISVILSLIQSQLMTTTTQRIGTIMDADRIVVLDDGKAVGIGTHAQLLNSCPVYRQIAESQLSKEELAR